MNQKLFVSLLLGAACVAQAAPPANAPAVDLKPYAIAHQKFVLPNGLTVIVHEDQSVPVVGVNLWYHVGSRNEKRGKTGFAHLFEHFFFNGSENYPRGFREAMDDLGATDRNGTTSTDRTNFYETVPVSALERTLFLESDRMGYLANYISQDMLERERGVVQNEMRQMENQPYGRVWSEIAAKLYPYSHPYSWSVGGSMDDLNAASLDDIKRWYRSYYGPNNAVLSLAGAVTPERALELAQRYFGAIPPGPPLPRTESWIPRLERPIRDEMQDQVPQARIYRVYHAPAWKDPQVQHLGLFAAVLAGSKSARLDRRLVYEKALATSVSASMNGREISGQFMIVATVKPGIDPRLVEAEIDSVVNELIEQGPSAHELKRVKTASLAAYARSLEALGERANTLSEHMTYGGSPDAALPMLANMTQATALEVKSSAATWLRAHHYTMTVKPFAKVAATPTTLDRKLLPALGEAPEVKFPAMQRAQLGNGLKVILLERHGAPIVNVALALDAGVAAEAPEQAGAASLALDLLDKGSRTRNAFQLSDALESLGARMTASTQSDQSVVRLQSTAANLTPSLALLADAVLNPAFAADQLALQKQRRLAQIAQERASPGALAMRLMPALLYGARHVYGRPASGFEHTVNAVTRDDLVQWHASWFKPGSATLIVSGDTTLAKLMPALEASFGAWRGGAAPAKAVNAPAAGAPRKIYLVDKPDAPQSTIVAAHLSQVQGQREDLAIETVMLNFGGIATSRLNRNLRLDKHWSYGSSGMLSGQRGQRAFMVIAPVQTDKTREAMLEVAKEIRGVAGERPLAGEEYASVMRYTGARLAGRFETLDELEKAALRSVNLGLPDDYWSRYAANIAALSQAQMATAAQKFVKPEELVWLIIGDVRKIEAAVRELNWGEVVLLGTDGQPQR